MTHSFPTRRSSDLQRLGMGEVEAQTVRRNETALLRHMPPETLSQSGVKQVRGAVVRADAIPALNIDAEVNGGADSNLARCYFRLMRVQPAARLARVENGRGPTFIDRKGTRGGKS